MSTINSPKHREKRICPLADYDSKEPFADRFMALKSEHPYVRFAQAHCASWHESAPAIGEAERIVGIPRPRRVVESNISSGLVFNRALCERLMDESDPKQQHKMQALLGYFPEQHVTRHLISGESARRGAPYHSAIGSGASFQGHMVIDFPKILRVVIPGLRHEIEGSMSACDDL